MAWQMFGERMKNVRTFFAISVQEMWLLVLHSWFLNGLFISPMYIYFHIFDREMSGVMGSKIDSCLLILLQCVVPKRIISILGLL